MLITLMFSDVPSCFISSGHVSALYLVSAACILDFMQLLISNAEHFGSINSPFAFVIQV